MNDPLAFLAGGGEAARMIRARDWSDHPLGHPEGWPEGLRTALSLVLNSPESMILAWGPGLHFFFNDTYVPLLGPRLQWAMGERFDEVWADGWEQAKPIIDDAFAGRSRRFEDVPWKLDTDRGARDTWWSFSYSRVLDGDGRVAGLFIFTNETTARVLGDRALRESEDHFRHTVELHPQVPWTADPQGNITSYSPRWLELTGQAAGEPDGAGWVRALHPGDLETTMSAFAASLGSGEPVDVDYRIRVAATGEHRWMRARAHPRRDEAGAIIRWYGVVEDVHDRKLAEAALRESEGRLRLVVEGARDHAILTTDPGGLVTSWSAGAEAILGWTAAEAVGQSAAVIFTPEDRADGADVRELVTSAREGCANDERWHVAKSGRRVFLNGSVHPLPLDEHGRPRGFIKVARDETQRRQAGRRLELEAERQRLSLQQMPGFAAILDGPEHRYAYVNDAYVRVGGARDYLGRTVREVFPELAGQGFHELLDRVYAIGEPFSARAMPIRLAGEDTDRFIDLLFQPVRADDDAVSGIFVGGYDVTEAHRTAAALAESEAQFRAFAEAVPNHVWASRPDGHLYWFNAQAYAYAGVEPGSLDGVTEWGRIVHPDDIPSAAEAWSRSLSTGAVYDAEFRIRRADGAYRWFLVRAEPVRSADGAVVNWVGTNTDVDERRRQAEELRSLNATLEERVAARTEALMAAEAALRQAQKMEAVGQLTGGLAHDFNNLLAGISGSLEMVGNRLAQGRIADVEKYMTVAQGASRRAAALTHRLLAFSRQQTLDPKPTDVNRLVDGMGDLIRRTVGPGIHVEVVGASGLWPALVDPPQLENALLNLCINARDAMPDGGRITVETANRWLDDRGARERDLEPGQYLSLCVTDTGTGMPPDVIAKAFDPFFTTKPIGQGTGLGLSMIYGFARQSGGQARIYSEIGQGTTVCLYLPRHNGPVEEDAAPARSALPRSEQGETVLVVDDEPSVRMLVTDILGDLGYTAVEAADSVGGLRVLRSDVRIDLLVTDVGLPGGMNGRQMADAAKVGRPDLKVLFVTGYAENAVIGGGNLGPGMSVMTKPFSIEAMAERVRAMIEA